MIIWRNFYTSKKNPLKSQNQKLLFFWKYSKSFLLRVELYQKSVYGMFKWKWSSVSKNNSQLNVILYTYCIHILYPYILYTYCIHIVSCIHIVYSRTNYSINAHVVYRNVLLEYTEVWKLAHFKLSELFLMEGLSNPCVTCLTVQALVTSHDLKGSIHILGLTIIYNGFDTLLNRNYLSVVTDDFSAQIQPWLFL